MRRRGVPMVVRRIVVHTDFSEASAAAVKYARALANDLGATLQFLHVLQEPLSAGWTAEVSTAALPRVQQAMEVKAEQWLNRMLPEEEQERYQAKVDFETGDIAQEIARYARAQAADIVILGASRDANVQTADTAVAEQVLRRCRCSVFVVRT